MNQGMLLQRIIHVESGKEVDLSYRMESTYIETLGLDGPKLLLTFNDKDSYLRDTLRVRERHVFNVTLSDAWGTEGMEITLPFTVLTAPGKEALTVKYNLMAAPVYDLKTLADKALMFNGKDVGGILGKLLPGVRQDVDVFPVVESYHRLIGERSSGMLRQLAQEQGAHVWYARGAVHFKTMKSMMPAAPAFEYHYGKHDERYRIATYAKIGRQTELQENVIRNYAGWNDITGKIRTPAGARPNDGCVLPVQKGDTAWVDFPFGDTRRPRIVGSVHHMPGKEPAVPHDAWQGGGALEHKRTGEQPAPDAPGYHEDVVFRQHGVVVQITRQGAFRVTQAASGTAVEISPDGSVVLHSEKDLYMSAEGNCLIEIKKDYELRVGGDMKQTAAGAGQMTAVKNMAVGSSDESLSLHAAKQGTMIGPGGLNLRGRRKSTEKRTLPGIWPWPTASGPARRLWIPPGTRTTTGIEGGQENEKPRRSGAEDRESADVRKQPIRCGPRWGR